MQVSRELLRAVGLMPALILGVSACGLPAFPNQFPATDMQVASDGRYVIVATNDQMQVTDWKHPTGVRTWMGPGGFVKGRQVILGLGPGADFVTPGMDWCATDHRLFYDTTWGRWVFEGLTRVGGQLHACLAVSKTADPLLGGWWVGQVTATPLCDGARMSHTVWYIYLRGVGCGGTDAPVSIIPKNKVYAGDFRWTVYRTLGLPAAHVTPILSADPLPDHVVGFVSSLIDHQNIITHQRVTLHHITTNQTIHRDVPVYETHPATMLAPGGVRITAGARLNNAWLDPGSSRLWLTGATWSGLGYAEAYIEQLWPVRWSNEAIRLDTVLSVRRPNRHVGFVAVAYGGSPPRLWITGMETAPNLWPSHFIGWLTPAPGFMIGPTLVTAADAILGVGMQLPPGYNSGEGYGPTVFAPGERGPDYLHANPSPDGTMYLAGQWSCGGLWCLHAVGILPNTVQRFE